MAIEENRTNSRSLDEAVEHLEEAEVHLEHAREDEAKAEREVKEASDRRIFMASWLYPPCLSACVRWLSSPSTKMLVSGSEYWAERRSTSRWDKEVALGVYQGRSDYRSLKHGGFEH